MPIPERPSLEFDKKQAKRLLAQVKRGDPQACARFCTGHPRYPDTSRLSTTEPTLSDAQLVIAREYGFASWPRWRHFVDLCQLDEGQKAASFLAAVCSAKVEIARQMLAVNHEFLRANLAAASAAGEVNHVRTLIDARPQAVREASGPYAAEPLAYACQSRLLATDPLRRDGIIACVQLLLDAGADPDAGLLYEGGQDPDDRKTALYGAAGIANDPDLTRMLLQAGADPNDGLKGKPGETLYHVTEFEDTRCLEMILKAKPDLVAVSYCLGRAVDFRNPAAALLFVEHGADVEHRVSWFSGETHLMKAITHGRDSSLIEVMITKAKDLNMRDDNGFSAYRRAVRAGRRDIAELLAAKGVDTADVTDIDRAVGACMAGDTAAVAALLADNPEIAASFNEVDNNMLSMAAREMNRGAVELLVQLGVPIDANPDMPALHECCYSGDLAGVEQVLALGASIESINVHGGTALGAAIYGSVDCHDAIGGPAAKPPGLVPDRGYAAIVQRLLQRGATRPASVAGSPAVMEVLQGYGVGDAEAE